jgi:hypothetical protein
MPIFKMYCNGFTGGVPPTKVNLEPSKRGVVTGWSESATRRNTKFLYSVDHNALTGYGYALTLTLRDLPPTPQDWANLVLKLFKRLRKSFPLLRYHWVTEWQKRGVPHLHCVVYFENPLTPQELHKIKNDWCTSAKSALPLCGRLPMVTSQTVKPVTDSQGWTKYLAKHGSRGLKHYQRAGKPAQWLKTGRMWGKGGKWPTREAEGEVTLNQFHKLRRLAKRWRIANARVPQEMHIELIDGKLMKYTEAMNERYGLNYFTKPRNVKRIAYARKSLKCNERKLSTVRGFSEWIPEELAERMLQATMMF